MTAISLPVVYTDTGPPTTVSWPITQGASGVDLTTVTGISFTVTRPDGSTTTWTGSIQAGATKTALTALYAFALGDTAIAGLYTLRPVLLVPGGSVDVYPPQQIRSITPATLQ